MIVLQAMACGAAAQRILTAGEPGAVIGLTSRGIFCATLSGKVVFVSFEAWRGPLTINLVSTELTREGGEAPRPDFHKGLALFDRVVQNSPVEFQAGQLSFVKEDIRVQTAQLASWQAAWTPLERRVGSDLSPKGRRTATPLQIAAISPQILARYRQARDRSGQAERRQGLERLLQRWTEQPGILAQTRN